MKYHIEVHGCQMNSSDAERVATVCEQNGYQRTENWREADLVLYVSCSIKQKAEDKIIGHMKELGKLKEKNPRLRVGITGCMVRITSTQEDEEKDKILKMINTVDFVFRMEDLDQVNYMLREKTPNDVARNYGDPTYLSVEATLSSPFRGYLPIMSGCDNFCTFCIVPYSRGRERSRLMSEIVNDAKQMATKGVTELLLIGQNVNSYGNKTDVFDESFQDDEKEHPFTRLLRELNEVEGIKRIRYTSPHPKDITEELIIAMTELENVCEQVHLPLQSGDDEMLKRMNRHYTAEHFLSLVRMIRKYMPRAGITTDIIVGFSGETEEQLQATAVVCREAEFDLSYTSKYSERKETYAGRFLEDDIPNEEKNRRYHVINDIIRETSHENNKQYVGELWEIFIDEIKDGIASGKTRTARSVRVPDNGSLQVGDIVDVKIETALEWIMEGSIVQVREQRSLKEKNQVAKKSLPVLS
jgi:tRNA-2-methylthio-N6-dimethylallyladenosine synthase